MDVDGHSDEPPAKIKPPKDIADPPILYSQTDDSTSVSPLAVPLTSPPAAYPSVPPASVVDHPPSSSSSTSGMSSSSKSAASVQQRHAKSTSEKRNRCYPESFKGPYEVFVRQRDKPVKVLLVSAEVHKHFRSVKEVKELGSSKVRIIFSDRTEANNVVQNELLSRLYRVYIPSEQVEIDGVINQAEMDMDYLVQNGVG